MLTTLAGCTARPIRSATPATTPTADPASPIVTAAGLSDSTYAPALEAVVRPPAGWGLEPVKGSGQHRHQVWKSPTGNTAYGVIRFTLPLPVGHEIALVGFLQNMRKSEGEAILVEKARDPRTGGLAFVAEGGIYRVRTVLNVRGRRGWAVYAGTLRDRETNEKELELAVRAREHTVIGPPPPPAAAGDR